MVFHYLTVITVLDSGLFYSFGSEFNSPEQEILLEKQINPLRNPQLLLDKDSKWKRTLKIKKNVSLVIKEILSVLNSLTRHCGYYSQIASKSK